MYKIVIKSDVVKNNLWISEKNIDKLYICVVIFKYSYVVFRYVLFMVIIEISKKRIQECINLFEVF